MFKLGFFIFLVSAVVNKAVLVEGELLGSGEVYGHAWSHWRHLNKPPDGYRWAVGDESLQAIDPLPGLISGGLGKIVDPAFGYNTWIALCVALAAFGGWRLARALGGNPFVGALALAWSPPFIGALRSGLTEDGAIGLTALAVAFLYEKKGITSGLCLGISAWCGILLGWIGALTIGLLSLSKIYRKTMSPKTLLYCAITAALITLPAAAPHADRILKSDINPALAGSIFNWQLNSVLHTDVLSLLYWGRVDLSDPNLRVHPGYLGVSILFLVACSKRWAMIFSLLALVVFSFGPAVYSEGLLLVETNPVHWLFDHIPGSKSIRHHGRVLLAGTVIAAGAASVGILKAGRYVAPITLIIALDLAFLSPISPTLPITKSTKSEAMLALSQLPAGTLAVVPASGPETAHQEALWIQRIHQKPLRLNPNRPGLTRRETQYPFGKWLNGIAFSNVPFRGDIHLGSVDYLAVKSRFAQRIPITMGEPDISDEQWKVWILDAGLKKEQKNIGKSMN